MILCIAALIAACGTATAAPNVASLTVALKSGTKMAAAAPTSAEAAPDPMPQDVRLEALGMGDMVRVSVFRNP
jgi:hypothetical protein